MRKLIKNIKAWYYRRKVIDAAKTLLIFDKVMIKANYDRATRRRFWKAMHTSREEVVKVLVDISRR
jgi:hypothetical protein